jgi:hypothetical protein
MRLRVDAVDLGREYAKVAFDKEHLKKEPTLEWVTPGHPLFETVRHDVIEQVHPQLERGAIFYDLQPADPYVLDVFAASVKDGRGNTLHRGLFVVETSGSGQMTVRQPTLFFRYYARTCRSSPIRQPPDTRPHAR